MFIALIKKYRASLSVAVIVVLLTLSAVHYHNSAVEMKAQRDKAKEQLSQANATITDMEARQRDVAALDAKYTKELADAKAENETLRADVAAGRKRLHVNAICVSTTDKTTGTASVDNAARPRLDDTAQRNYFTLRERLITMQKQLEGAQDYIRTQCLMSTSQTQGE